jgi:hypothetical protein
MFVFSIASVLALGPTKCLLWQIVGGAIKGAEPKLALLSSAEFVHGVMHPLPHTSSTFALSVQWILYRKVCDGQTVSLMSVTRLCSFRSCLFDCQAALKIRPCYPKAQARAAQCCMFLQRYDDCITLCDKILLAAPTDKITLELRARAVAGKVSLVQQDSQKLMSLKLSDT